MSIRPAISTSLASPTLEGAGVHLAGELGHDRGRFSESRDGEVLALLAELFGGDVAVRPEGLVVEREFDPRLGLRA